MKKKTKPNPAAFIERARIDISVAKYRWIAYKGKRITYDLILKQLGGREQIIAFLKEHAPKFHSPPGFYGGNIAYSWQFEEAHALLLKTGLEATHLKREVRFFVTLNGVAAPDTNPDPRTHEIRWDQWHGFEKRSDANIAARSRFAYYNAWCRDDSGKKRTNVVTLKIYDKEGNLTEEKSN